MNMSTAARGSMLRSSWKLLMVFGLSTLLIAPQHMCSANEGVDNEAQPLTADEFNKLIGTKHILAKFYAPWCGHCQKLAPTWQRLSEVFRAESRDVEIIRVNAEDETELSSKFKVRGYPTILYFPKDWKEGIEPESYNNARTIEALVEYVNLKAGTMRLTDGSVRGRVSLADEVLGNVGCKGLSLASCASRMMEQLKQNAIEWKAAKPHEWEQRFINYYTTVLKKLWETAKDTTWISNEITRLSGIIQNHGDHVDRDTKMFFQGRRSILEHLSTVFSAAFNKDAAQEGSQEEL